VRVAVHNINSSAYDEQETAAAAASNFYSFNIAAVSKPFDPSAVSAILLFKRCNDEIPQVDHIIEPLRCDVLLTRANGTAANIYKQQQRSTTNSALTAAVAAAPAEKLPEARKFSLSQHSCSSLMGFQTQQIKFIDTIRAHVVLGKLLILFVICHPASAASFDSKAYLANKWRNHHLAHMGGSVGLTVSTSARPCC
jgi:hypothetical protein